MIYTREPTYISEVTRVETRTLEQHCMQCFQKLSRMYTFSTKYVRCGHSNYHPCQTCKLCNLLELLQSAPPLSRVHRPLDSTIQQAIENSRGIQGIPFAIRRRCYFLAFYKLSYVRETSPDVPNFSFDRAVEIRKMFFEEHSDRSSSSWCTFPFVDRCNVDQSERWRTCLSRACHVSVAKFFHSIVRTKIYIFPENHDRYFHQVDVFSMSRVLRDPSLKLVAHTLFFFFFFESC